MMLPTLNEHTWRHSEYPGICSQRHIQQLSKNRLDFIRSLLPVVLITLTSTCKTPMTTCYAVEGCCHEFFQSLYHPRGLFASYMQSFWTSSKCKVLFTLKQSQQLSVCSASAGARLQNVNTGDICSLLLWIWGFLMPKLQQLQ